MFAKYNGVRDEELVLRYKSSKESDLELELVDRYKIHSRKLAS